MRVHGASLLKRISQTSLRNLNRRWPAARSERSPERRGPRPASGEGKLELTEAPRSQDRGRENSRRVPLRSAVEGCRERCGSERPQATCRPTDGRINGPPNKKGSGRDRPLPFSTPTERPYFFLISNFACAVPPSATSTSASTLPANGCQATSLCLPAGTSLISNEPSSFTTV